jgi:hypothetical protein
MSLAGTSASPLPRQQPQHRQSQPGEYKAGRFRVVSDFDVGPDAAQAVGSWRSGGDEGAHMNRVKVMAEMESLGLIAGPGVVDVRAMGGEITVQDA